MRSAGRVECLLWGNQGLGWDNPQASSSPRAVFFPYVFYFNKHCSTCIQRKVKEPESREEERAERKQTLNKSQIILCSFCVYNMAFVLKMEKGFAWGQEHAPRALLALNTRSAFIFNPAPVYRMLHRDTEMSHLFYQIITRWGLIAAVV